MAIGLKNDFLQKSKLFSEETWLSCHYKSKFQQMAFCNSHARFPYDRKQDRRIVLFKHVRLTAQRLFRT